MRLRPLILTILILGMTAGVHAATESVPAQPKKTAESSVADLALEKDPLRTRMFIVETDDQSANESLDRISGHIDMGFASPEQTYQSEHQSSSGPFGATDQES